MIFYVFAVLSALQAVTKASNPYYYVPPRVQYHLPPPPPPVPAYNSFGNPFRTSTYYVNPHFQSYHSFANPIHQIQTPERYQAPITQQQNYEAETPQQQNYEAETPDYQGFAYHTRNDNGATSHVLFVSGPQSQTFRSTLFPTFNTETFRNIQKNTQTPVAAKNYASDMVDPVVKETEYPKNIQEIYTPPVTAAPMHQIQQEPGDFFRNFFQRSEPNVVNFFSKNSNLFVKPVSGYAANTFPLMPKMESNSRFYSSLINPRFEPPAQEDDTTTSTTTTEMVTVTTESIVEKKPENVAQESVITNTRFRINELIDRVEKLTAAASTMEPIVVEEISTEITTTSTTTTTENVKQVEQTEETTLKQVDETTIKQADETTIKQTEEVTTIQRESETSTASSEQFDLMKSLLSLFNQNSMSSSSSSSTTEDVNAKDVTTASEEINSTVFTTEDSIIETTQQQDIK